MGNLTKIQTITVPSGGQPSIQFSSIPNSYVDLFIVLSSRTNRAAANDYIKVYLNTDTTAGNYNTLRYFNSTTSITIQQLSNWDIELLPTTGNTATSSHFGSGFLYIQNYANSSYSKSISFRGGGTDNSSTSARSGGGDLCWTGTAAINQITIAPVTGTAFVENTTATLYGITGQSVGQSGSKATGGIVTTSGGYTYHTFTSSGNFTPTTNISNAEVLIVAGGGGAGSGGSWAAGGGGAGGLVYASSQSLNSGIKYPVVVGAGGTSAYAAESGRNGHDSFFGSLTIAKGGGGGGGYQGGGSTRYQAQVGGSGGGGPSGQSYGGSEAGAAGTAGQGNSGGLGYFNPNMTGGGGGGAGAVGANATTTRAGNGGNGVSTYSAWGAATSTGHNINGTYWYAGGGGGSSGGISFNSTVAGKGGSGGGGHGAGHYEARGSSGMPNTGGGAGAQNTWGTGSGGSGIVIVRYTT